MKRKIFLASIFIIATLCNAQFLWAAELVEFSQKADIETLSIRVPQISPRKVFTVQNPNRLVVDVPQVAGKHAVALPSNYHGKLIKAARFGNFDNKTSRFVFDLNAPVRVVSSKEDSGKLLLTITAGNSSVAASSSINSSDKKPTQKLQAVPPKKPLIAIDAGHGGVDPGTIGPRGTQEKDVVLGYATALKNRLLKSGKYRVILTRADDNFIMLRGRVAIARKAGASLFVSIHADSADELAARGLSVYTVSEQASDKEAEALAARENKSDIIGGMDLSDERPDVADILISLAQRETKNNSATFADLLVIALGNKVRLLPNTHRFAGFAVLKAPDIPSVLVEVGFLSHPEEEKQLKSKAYRDKVVEGIAAGIDDYFSKRNFADIGTK